MSERVHLTSPTGVAADVPADDRTQITQLKAQGWKVRPERVEPPKSPEKRETK